MKAVLLGGISEKTVKSLISIRTVSLEENPEVMFARSEKLSEGDLPKSLFAICRAGTGVDNIPVDWCTKNGVVVFNAPGANANAVKELVICLIIAAARNLPDILDFVGKKRGYDKKIVEAKRTEFRGNEIRGKTLGIIGVGAIGKMVARSAADLGMGIIGYDPYSRDENFQEIRRARTLEELSTCDFITLHCSATKETRGLVGEEFISKLKTGVIILNFGREELVDKEAIKTGLKNRRVKKYITDFHDPDLRCGFSDKVVTLVHAGALTEEAEQDAQEMVARQFLNFWNTGEIENSVNFPPFKPKNMPDGTARIIVCNINVPGRIAAASKVLGDTGYNIKLENDNRGEIGYMVIDIDNPNENLETAIQKISELDGITKVRIIHPRP